MADLKITLLLLPMIFVSCGDGRVPETASDNTTMLDPLAAASELPFHAPPFDRLNESHYKPAIIAGMAKQLAEVETITNHASPASFANTIEAMELTGTDLTRATKIFFNLTSSATTDSLQAIKADLAPQLTAHTDAITLNSALFQRIKAVHDQRTSSGLDPVQVRLVERYFQRFVRSGALLSEADKERLKKLNEEESNLNTQFQDNLLKGRTAAAVLVDTPEQLKGLSDEAIAAAAAAAKAKGKDGKYLVDILNTTAQPVLASLTDRTLRERIHNASIARNSEGAADNKPLVARIAQLRAQKARLFGFPNWAAYVMDDQMAKTPEAALKLLDGLAPAAANNAKKEAEKLQALVDRQKGGFSLEPWDWAFYSEQVRKATFDLDEADLKPYFEFGTVLQNGVFFAAEQLYGLSFKERKDLPVYHPDVRVFDIIDTGGVVIGLFYGDYYARDNKNGGAWMDSFVDQSDLLGQQPVITQNCNYVKPAPGQPCLLSFDDVTTLFHEFGHALHGMLSRQKYPLFSGTATSTDFVEFPSQINEHWATEARTLANYAKHYKTGEPMPAALVAKLHASDTFNQGYMTSEYLAAAFIDIEWHLLSADAPLVSDVDAFEKAALEKHGLQNALVPPRYKTCYFSHIWGGGYAANYYAYMWSEVLDADGCAWFDEHGGMTRANGMHFRSTVLSQGGSKDSGQLYRDFTGRDARLEPLLVRRGLK